MGDLIDSEPLGFKFGKRALNLHISSSIRKKVSLYMRGYQNKLSPKWDFSYFQLLLFWFIVSDDKPLEFYRQKH